jgi:Cu+-exporting ATPase
MRAFGPPMALDPVCGVAVNPHTAVWMLWYKGTPYYFCSEECHMAFDLHPETYRKRALERREKGAIY